MSEETSSPLAQLADNILGGSARPSRDDRLLVVFDGTASDVADAIIDASLRAGVPAVGCYTPFEMQKRYPIVAERPRITMLLESSAILITALTDANEGTPFRGSLVSAAMERKLKVIHMPGVSSALLLSSVRDVDFESLDRSACELASRLNDASRVRIVSRERSGKAHALEFSIAGREGYPDGGLARPGGIINMPTGEAFVAPVETTVAGSVVVNGAFPDWVFSEQDEVVLFFRAGSVDLSKSTTQKTPGARRFQEMLGSLEGEGDACLQLGEFGIGVNTSVKELVGDGLIDEKMAGTAHIALGRNDFMGGDNTCPFHQDIVFFPETVELDGEGLDLPWAWARPGGKS